MRSVVSSFIFLFLLTACTFEQAPPMQGPDGSWWLGGANGGAFVKIEDDENRNDLIYKGTIYFDSDQSIWYRGPFKLVGNAKFAPDKHELYEAWDGERLHLQG